MNREAITILKGGHEIGTLDDVASSNRPMVGGPGTKVKRKRKKGMKRRRKRRRRKRLVRGSRVE